MAKKNKMGYIYPHRIQSILRGENTRIQIGWEGTKERKEGEIIVDSQGREWEIKNGYRIRVTKLDDARIPLFCPKCKKIMKKSLDPNIFIKFGFCLDCLTDRDTKMMIDGTFWEYEKEYQEKKRFHFLKDAKREIEEYLKNLSDEINFVDVDGSTQKWQGDISELRKFLEKELEKINEQLETLQDVEKCQQTEKIS